MGPNMYVKIYVILQMYNYRDVRKKTILTNYAFFFTHPLRHNCIL